MLKMADTVKVTNAYVQSGVSGGAAYLLRTLTACFLSILLIRSTSVGQPQFGWRDRGSTERGSTRDSERPLLYSLVSNRSTINHSISRRSYKSVEEIETQRMRKLCAEIGKQVPRRIMTTKLQFHHIMTFISCKQSRTAAKCSRNMEI